MRKNMVTGGTKPETEDKTTGLDLLFLLTAVYGFLFLLDAAGVPMRTGILFPLCAVPGLVLWYLNRAGK